MNTAIIYYSKHHENTKKLLDAIQSQPNNVVGKVALHDFSFNILAAVCNANYVKSKMVNFYIP